MAEVHLPHTGDHGEHHAVDHEHSDVNIRAILSFGAALVAVTLFVSFIVWLLFGYFESRERQQSAREFPLAVEQENRLPPEPRLQTNPRQDLHDLRSEEE